MIRPNVQHSLANARSYFREHLSVGDYYSEQSHVAGEWYGAGAVELKLSGHVRALPFLALCDGNHPRSGMRLTQRRNSVRSVAGQLCANRRVFFDFVFSPPKSVSIAALLQDPRIVALHAAAVRTAMAELERFAETRVRRGGGNSTRRTGNLVVAMFQHETSRELDPHLHTHCVTFNATRDAVEGRWKALDVSEMYRAQKFAEACYQHELARGLKRLGYALVESPHNFEIRGIAPTLLALFSKRHRQIDEEARRVLASGTSIGDENVLRERIARDKRKRKIKDATADQLRPQWMHQLDPSQKATLAGVTPREAGTVPDAKPDLLLGWGEADVFERTAVARDYQVLTAALLRGRGAEFTLAGIKQAMEGRPYVRHEQSGDISLPDQLKVEQSLIACAQRGIGSRPSLGSAVILPPNLADEQRAAATSILNSRDSIVVFRGGAGTGKSYVMKQVVDALQKQHTVVVAAPQNQQVLGLARDGLKAQTLSSLLLTEKIPYGAVVVLDEAGQVSARQLLRLGNLVEARMGRLLLCGDTRQHGAVEASDGLVLLEQRANLKPINLTTIRRQDPARAASDAEREAIRTYRRAVETASALKTTESFDLLDRQGWIREVFPGEIQASLSHAFSAARARGEDVLAIAQTRAAVADLNTAIRERLLADGVLGETRRLQTIQDIGSTVAARQNPASYASGTKIVFLRSYGRFKKGDVATVTASTESGLLVEKDDRRSRLGFSNVARFAIATQNEIDVSVGEKLQLKFNGKSADGYRIANGEFVTVLVHRADGGLSIRDERGQVKTLLAAQRQFDLGYATTSYGSQGKTVDTVLFADAGERAATNQKQWYVTISRGRKRVTVFTDDKDRLLADVCQSGVRKLASDAMAQRSASTRGESVQHSPSAAPNYFEIAKTYNFLQRWRSKRAAIAIRPGIRPRFRP